ncbi:MAG TPA: crossover junction endodeoxyribonuclease RuvC [Firmicutes bacterium]|nr:crossover junction endodeoxyribonuclease RuvC [Bacillota bacterium]
MLVIGIDPGTATTGYGIVRNSAGRLIAVDYGYIKTPAREKPEARLEEIYLGVQALIDRYRPDAVAVEELFFNRNAKTALAVGQARGVILLAVARSRVELFEYTPLQVKQAIAGYGRADKAQMQRMIKLLLGLTEIPSPDDAADALAVAVCHIHSVRFRASIKHAGEIDK